MNTLKSHIPWFSFSGRFCYSWLSSQIDRDFINFPEYTANIFGFTMVMYSTIPKEIRTNYLRMLTMGGEMA
jgi:hypothetical protein